jgi:hypothetical protein
MVHYKMIVIYAVLLITFPLGFFVTEDLIQNIPSQPGEYISSPGLVSTQEVTKSSSRILKQLNSETSCHIENCRACNSDRSKCQSCFSGYDLINGRCKNESRKSSESIGVVPLVCLIVGLIVFSVIFCAV